MILAYADCSKDDPIASVGYVLLRTKNGEETLLDTGTRVWNVREDDRDITWTTGRLEYYGAIVACRAAQDYTSEPIVIHLDNAGIVKAIKNDSWHHEPYFPHCLRSFMHRFDDWAVRIVHRKRNEKAHQQARTGLKIGREIHRGLA